MTGKDAIKKALTSTQDLLNQYVSDLSDADLLVRPVPGANHAAWQLGHLVEAETYILGSSLPPGTYPNLPPALQGKHGKATASTDAPGSFLKKAEYVAAFNKVRQATLAAVERMSDADLDRASTGDMAKWAPTVGDLLVLTANHTLMHGGQFTVLRRKLGKPVLF